VLHHFGVGDCAAGVVLDEEAPAGQVAWAREHEPEGRLVVAAGATHLLVVGLDGSGWSQVDHRAHVGPVDSHAEGVGGDDDLGLPVGEAALGGRAAFGVEARVIAIHPPALVREPLALLFGSAARRRVDDRGALPLAGAAQGLGQGAVDRGLALALALHLGDAEREIRAGEAA